MSFTLYSNKGSGGLAVEAALAKAGAAHEIVTIDYDKDEQKTAAYAAINPMRQVPAMTLPDGTLMTESAAMLLHLADLYPDKRLAPPPGTPARGRLLRWMLFMATNLYEPDLRYFYPERYTTDPTGLDGVKSAAKVHMARGFGIIEEALDPFVAGREMSVADVYLAMLIGWSPEPLASAKLQAVLAAVKADTDYGPVWRRHGLAD